MELSELVASVWKTFDQVSPADAAPTIFDAPDSTSLAELVAEVGRLAGRPRNLAAGGFTDPSLTERKGLPLVEPFGEELLEMRGWAYGSHWIGCGQVTRPEGTCSVIVVAPREDPASTGFPEGASWAEKLRILTGWEPMSRSVVDWPATESALGTPLPNDYKEIVDLFGAGGFDDYVDLLVPGSLGMDLVDWSKGDATHAENWRPHAVYTARHGLLRWGTSEQEIDFVWQTGGTDPDDWPVLVQHDFGKWERFDCGAGEFILRMLTDVQFGFLTSHMTDHYFATFRF